MGRRSWDGARSIVTGASSGIGAAVAEALACQRGRLVLSGRREDALAAVTERCRESGAEVEAVIGDLTEPGVPEQVAGAAVSRFGGTDLLVHSAGVSTSALFAEVEPAVLRHVFEVNFFSLVELTRLALPSLVDSRGHIVVLSSLTGLVGTPTRSVYAATKHALHGLFGGLRVELRPHGVGVTIVCPGYVDTPIRERALLADGSPQEVDPVAGRPMLTADQVARSTLAAASRGKRLVLMGRETWLARGLSLLAPSLLDRILERSPG